MGNPEKAAVEPQTPEELITAIHQLDARYKTVKDAIRDKRAKVDNALKYYTIMIRKMKIEYSSQPETLTALQEAEEDLNDLRAAFDKGYGEFSLDNAKDKDKVVAQYKYSPERFKTKAQYIDYLAANLTTEDKMNRFLKFLYRYEHDSMQDKETFEVNTCKVATAGEKWKSPKDFTTTFNNEGKFFGDCEDIALLFEEILRKQGKKPFFFLIPGHALTGWIDKDANNETTVSIVDTTRVEKGEEMDAEVKTLYVDPSKNIQETFDELMEGIFSSVGEQLGGAIANTYNPEALGLAFHFDDGRNFTIKGNFSLAKRYQELRECFQKNNYSGAIQIVEAELAKDPQNKFLKSTKSELQQKYMLYTKGPT